MKKAIGKAPNKVNSLNQIPASNNEEHEIFRAPTRFLKVSG